MQWREKTGQTLTEPVTTAELKTYIGYNSTDQDSYFSDLITMARRYVENYSGHSAIQKIYQVWFDVNEGNDGWYTLPFQPFSSITNVQYDGSDITYIQKGLTEVQIYPYLTTDNYKGINVEYTAGASDQIKILKDAIYEICLSSFADKKGELVIPKSAKAKLAVITPMI